MSENKDKPNKGQDTPRVQVFDAAGLPAPAPSGGELWTQREWRDRDKDAGYYRQDDDAGDDAAAPVE